MPEDGKHIYADPAIVFGPVPSRRLGRSLGINNIPPKACSYACVYCQVGPTPVQEIVPHAFHPPQSIVATVSAHVEKLRERGERIDYLTFVPDGEPSLDAHLGDTIERLKPLGVPIAVISNASLVWRAEVRDGLSRADWVSLKVDAVDEPAWKKVNRPHPELALADILSGIQIFAAMYQGTLATETMLVAGLNDSDAAFAGVAEYLGRVAPHTAYLGVPTRPPTLPGTRGPDEGTLNRAFQTLAARLERVELLVGYEGDAFCATGDAESDLLSITAVHPMRAQAVRALLERCGAHWSLVERLVDEGALRELSYAGTRYYIRRLPSEFDRHGQ
jgi:wyosine [tRNA(Phe)-imidazoG37] synthetase (radical SAM superfamily)